MKFNVQVGDIFCAQWGYEQTNADFFQVIKIVGESSVRVVEIELTAEKHYTGNMSADCIYQIDRSPKPRKAQSTFIKDQINGDLKRMKSYSADGKSNPQIKITSFADAYICVPGSCITYESWYA